MNYRHAYHVAGFADVMKHSILVALVQALQHKEGGFLYLDTHAGIGRYDLQAEAAQKTLEYEKGINLVLQQKNLPSEFETYVQILKKDNSIAQKNLLEKIRFYPGSPLWVRYLLRPQDRMILTELHDDDYRVLQKEFAHDKQVKIYHEDGYHALKSYLPPIERRGLVLIDPPFENADEFKIIINGIHEGIKRFATGTYMIWYPIKNTQNVKKFKQNLLANFSKVLISELSIFPEDSPLLLNGSGVVIVNPPFQFDLMLQKMLPWLWRALSPHKTGGYEVDYHEKTT